MAKIFLTLKTNFFTNFFPLWSLSPRWNTYSNFRPKTIYHWASMSSLRRGNPKVIVAHHPLLPTLKKSEELKCSVVARTVKA